jgi:DNA uptake protein ComE-like DNA-binding protein
VQAESAPAALSDEDAAFAWLESLAARQGATDALLLTPDERRETPPEWVLEDAAEAAAPPAAEMAPVEAAVEVEPTIQAEASETTLETAVEQAGVVEQIMMEAPAAPEAQAPVKAVLEAPVETVEPVAEAEAAPIEEAPVESFAEAAPAGEAVPELPAWLQGIDTAADETVAPWESPLEPAPVEAFPAIPQLDLNTAGLAQLERLPGLGFIKAQLIINRRQEKGAFASLDELLELPDFDRELVDSLGGLLFVAAPAAVAAITPPPAATAAPADFLSEDSQIVLIQARNALIQGDLADSLARYNGLVKNRQFLPEVITDLHEALYRHPAEFGIWQALGDAYARNEQIQEALDAYTQAEELLT